MRNLRRSSTKEWVDMYLKQKGFFTFWNVCFVFIIHIENSYAMSFDECLLLDQLTKDEGPQNRLFRFPSITGVRAEPQIQIEPSLLNPTRLLEGVEELRGQDTRGLNREKQALTAILTDTHSHDLGMRTFVYYYLQIRKHASISTENLRHYIQKIPTLTEGEWKGFLRVLERAQELATRLRTPQIPAAHFLWLVENDHRDPLPVLLKFRIPEGLDREGQKSFSREFMARHSEHIGTRVKTYLTGRGSRTVQSYTTVQRDNFDTVLRVMREESPEFLSLEIVEQTEPRPKHQEYPF